MGQVCCTEDQSKYETSQIQQRNQYQSTYSEEQLKTILLSHYQISIVCQNYPEFSFQIFLEQEKIDQQQYTLKEIQDIALQEFKDRYSLIKPCNLRNLIYFHNPENIKVSLDVFPLFFKVLQPNSSYNKQSISSNMTFNQNKQSKLSTRDTQSISDDQIIYNLKIKLQGQDKLWDITILGGDKLKKLDRMLKSQQQQISDNKDIIEEEYLMESEYNTEIDEINNSQLLAFQNLTYHLFYRGRKLKIDENLENTISSFFPYKLLKKEQDKSQIEFSKSQQLFPDNTKQNKTSYINQVLKNSVSDNFTTEKNCNEITILLQFKPRKHNLTETLTIQEAFQPDEYQMNNESCIVQGYGDYHRKLKQGINVEIICKNKKCLFFEKRQIIPVDQRVLDLKASKQQIDCQSCKQQEKYGFIGLYRCSFYFLGIFNSGKRHGGLDLQFVVIYSNHSN
ncbi:hypothetical protein PPERSA_04155 [Pseudocohnilembus persalinus]|uniref:Uncharacterized protein n=1 Tax=Pseudocohnilembus persalinus TaxID=266149 RepID=A0A0V0QMP2_PSEPJ|nr:hypothetical protein PPERSA_04155 [Pseudocohnilembus persalinus]|eukprot:KRX03603.1 hypothetical protein PPERSA_04155 [Pseudocohnilembus persalinus]